MPIPPENITTKHPATVEVSTRRKWKLWPRAPAFLHMPAPHKPTVACSRNPCPETICPIFPQKGNGREDLSDQIWPERFHTFFTTMDHHWYHSHWGANLPCFSMEIRSEAIQMPQLLDVQSIPGVAVLRAGGCQSAWHRGAIHPGLGLTQSDVCDSYQIAPDKWCLLGLDTSWNFIDIQVHCHGLTISLCVKLQQCGSERPHDSICCVILDDLGGTPHCGKLPYVRKMVPGKTPNSKTSLSPEKCLRWPKRLLSRARDSLVSSTGIMYPIGTGNGASKAADPETTEPTGVVFKK